MEEAVTVQVPVGVWLGSKLHRRADIRPLSGRDERFLVEREAWGSAAARATAILARCVVRVGTVPMTAGLARALTVGDREALLLHLLALSFGDRFATVVVCQAAGCDARMDVDLPVPELLIPAVRNPKPVHEAEIESGGQRLRVRFRLPTGQDLESVADGALDDPSAAVGALIDRCVESVTTADGGTIPPGIERRLRRAGRDAGRDLPASVVDPLSRVISGLDPQAETLVQGRCSSCGSEFSLPLDAGALLWQTVAARSPDLDREIHLLAITYHWSERELLDMTARDRERYAALLAETLSTGRRAS